MGILERRLRERARRTQEIIDAAKRTFSAKGFSNTTMNDIADSSELSRRTLYLYFKSKEQLALAMTAGALTELRQGFARIARETGSAFDRLRRMLEAYRAMMVADPGRFQFLVTFSENAKAVPKDSEELRSCEESLGTIEATLGVLLREGLADKSLHFIEESDLLAKTLTFIVHSVAAASINYRGSLHHADESLLDSIFENTLGIVKHYIKVKS
jgi:AcrR family transcriptional regulator